MRIKWPLLLLAAAILMTSISCQGAAFRRDQIPCRPASPTAPPAGEGKITIAWDFSDREKTAGFRIFYGPGPRKYKECVDIGMPPESSPGVVKHTLTGLEPGRKYHIAVIAYDKNHNESDFSGEVSATAQ